MTWFKTLIGKLTGTQPTTPPGAASSTVPAPAPPIQTSPRGLELLRQREGVRLKAYQDTKGIWTIGVGHTGPEVHPGMVITQAQCDAYLAKDIKWAEECVRRHVRVPLQQHQFDALVSFIFNIGGGAFATSTLLKLLNEKQYAAAAEQFLRWVKQPELKGRRIGERAQFLGES
jgi:lysozyme